VRGMVVEEGKGRSRGKGGVGGKEEVVWVLCRKRYQAVRSRED